MKLFSIETGNLMLDGGAMFGVVPKVLWEKVYPVNEKNLVNLAMRALLIVDGDQTIIVDTGIGNKQDEKFFSHYYLNGDDSLQQSLANAGFSVNDITDVILTHLHFDHCGGGIYFNDNDIPELTFKNAKYWTSKPQWESAVQPNEREKASFLKENILPIKKNGKLNFIDHLEKVSPHVTIRLFDGHTAGQVIPFIEYKNKTLVYIADVIPSVANIPLSWITAYDMQPLVALEEKKAFLNEAVENDYTLFFEHDILFECCNLQKTDKGVRVKETFSLAEWGNFQL